MVLLVRLVLLLNAQMIRDANCVALFALMEHAWIVWTVTSSRAPHALHVVLTVIPARAVLSALPVPPATILTLTVAAQHVNLHAMTATVKQSAITVTLVTISLQTILASVVVLSIALVAMAMMYAINAIVETCRIPSITPVFGSPIMLLNIVLQAMELSSSTNVITDFMLILANISAMHVVLTVISARALLNALPALTASM